MTLEEHEKRLAVLEKLSENCDEQRTDTNKRLVGLERKLDSHLLATNASQLETAKAVTRLATTVEGMALDLKDALVGASLAVSHETQWRVIGKLATVISASIIVVVSAAWTVFSFVAK